MKYLAPTHVAIALFIQLLSWLVLGVYFGHPVIGLFVGAALGDAWFLSREETQAEYRWIEAFGAGRRANMPWYAPFQRRAWNLKGITDFVVPALVTGIIAEAARRLT